MGGSGGSSGKVDFPGYMKTAHQDWLDDTGADNMTYSIVDLMNTAMGGASPYNGYTPKNPDDAFFAATKDLGDYSSAYEILKGFDEWGIDTAFDTYMADDAAFITAAVAAHSSQLDDELNNSVLPAFKAGMANINATMGSAFVIGEAKLWDSKVKKVAETDANIRLQRIQQGSEISIKRMGVWADWKKALTQVSGEYSRLYLAASFERDNNYMEKLHKDAVWDMEMYAYGTQVMACISGVASTVVEGGKGSALGGAMSGAAMGAMAFPANPLLGAAVGGAIGLAGSL